jgi:CRISPR/Cas system-associated exonuclease Cas4 (RecB family)
VRVTDHKTGKARVEEGEIVAGGAALQPVLYALAAEKLFPETQVVEGRLDYCTSTGGFEVVSVPLDARARESARVLSDALGRGLDDGFLPAFPVERACDYCDYRVVCGPHEWLRSQRKRGGPGAEALAALAKLRELP